MTNKTINVSMKIEIKYIFPQRGIMSANIPQNPPPNQPVQTQGVNSTTQPSVGLYTATVEMAELVVLIGQSGNISNITPLEASVLSQAIINYNNQYTANPMPADSPYTQLENALTSPLLGPGSPSMLTLSQNGDISSIQKVFDDQNVGQASLGTATNFLNNAPSPQGYGKNGTQQLIWDVESLQTDLNDGNIAGAATQIQSICTDLDNIGSNLDPMLQLLDWTLTTPFPPSNNSMLTAAQNGNLTELGEQINGGTDSPSNALFLNNLLNTVISFETNSGVGSGW